MPFSKKFKSLISNLEETKIGEPVPKKLQARFGKVFDKDEIVSLAFGIARSKNIKIDSGGGKKK